MSEPIDMTKLEQTVRREAQKRFRREYGRTGTENITLFTLDMIRKALGNRQQALVPDSESGLLPIA